MENVAKVRILNYLPDTLSLMKSGKFGFMWVRLVNGELKDAYVASSSINNSRPHLGKHHSPALCPFTTIEHCGLCLTNSLAWSVKYLRNNIPSRKVQTNGGRWYSMLELLTIPTLIPTALQCIYKDFLDLSMTILF